MGRPRKDAATQHVRERLIAAMAARLIREPVDAVTVSSLIKEVGCNRSTFYYHFADAGELAEAAFDAMVPVEIPQAVLAFVQQGAPLRENVSESKGERAGGIPGGKGVIGVDATARSVAREGAAREGATGTDAPGRGATGTTAAGRGAASCPLSSANPSIPDLVRRNSSGIDTLCAMLNGPNAVLVQRRVKRRLLEDALPEMGKRLSLDVDDPTFRIVFEYASGGILALMAYRAETGFIYPVETFLHCLAPEVPAALLTVLSGK